MSNSLLCAVPFTKVKEAGVKYLKLKVLDLAQDFQVVMILYTLSNLYIDDISPLLVVISLQSYISEFRFLPYISVTSTAKSST